MLIGYLQFETPSMQMNNQDSNMFSENTFTYAGGRNGITNELMEKVYHYITDRVKEIKYGVSILTDVSDFNAMMKSNQRINASKGSVVTAGKRVDEEDIAALEFDEGDYIDIACPYCAETLSVMRGEANIVCPYCDRTIEFE